MSKSEDYSFGSGHNEGKMLVSVAEGNQSHQVHCHDSLPVENIVRHRLPKFPLSMKNYCSIHLRLLHNLNEDRLHDLFILNPECQIKILEENLNLLSKKSSRSNDFKIKSNSCSVKTASTESSLSKNNLPSLTFKSMLRNESGVQSKTSEKDVHGETRRSNLLKDTVIFDSSRISVSHVLPRNGLLNKPSLSTPPILKIKGKYSGKQKQCHPLQLTHDNITNELNVPKPIIEDRATDSMKKKIDTDNLFEFTVAEEKIVSFVCSPPPSRKQRIYVGKNENVFDSDEDSEFSSSKGDSVSETVSNTSCKSDHSINFTKKDKFPLWGQIGAKNNKLLWHPPTSNKFVMPLSTNKQSLYSCLNSNSPLKQGQVEHFVNFKGPLNCTSPITSERSFKLSVNQETVLFREASLRGCYNIESILKDLKKPLHVVEQEVSNVREAIFSAVRLQQDNDAVVPDSILSILDICKSWIKLNSHFERKEFKDILELNGLDLTILNDFSQWQCVSRTLIDKLINILRIISLCKDSKTNAQLIPLATQESANYGAPSIATVSGDTTLNNFPTLIPKLYTPPVKNEAQGKHWKQRRFLSDQINSETAALKSKRLCKSKFTLCSSFENSQLLNSCNTEMLGQGDNASNFAHDCAKTNISYSTKNCHLVQGDMNLFLTGSKQQNTGFFDKTLNVRSSKCCNEREASAYPMSLTNDLCSSMTNVMELTGNNNFSINAPQTFPTIPPFYGNQFCLVNPTQYQSSFSQCLAKPNPIQCIDTDVGENCLKSSYMKPGSYNPPQKPPNFQKVINNNIPIEDVPVVGIPFLYSASQASNQQSKILEISNSSLQKDTSKDNSVKRSDDTWKTALSMAESFRDTMMSTKIDDGPNLKVSETVSLKSHFLLSDGNSEHSSSTGDYSKLNSDNEDLGFLDNISPDKNIPAVRAELKTTDWLVKSFNKIVLDGEQNSIRNAGYGDILSESEFVEISQSSEESNQQEVNKQTMSSSINVINVYSDSTNFNSEGKTSTQEETSNPTYFDTDAVLFQKKLKKNKRNRDDYNSSFERKHPMFHRKPKSLFKRSITKQVTCQLEDILNCIWNTKVSTLFNEEVRSEKEITRMELKVRSPLYLQAMRCKLTNHSYDTLDQALSDFQQYFVDIRTRNKGDKQCIEVVGALEQIFFNLVEKHFGLVYQPSPQYFGPLGLTSSIKPRRPKKTPRRT